MINKNILYKIISPMATGNGAYIVHHELEKSLDSYCLLPYNPWYTLFPPILRKFSDKNAEIVHTTPDYAPFFVNDNQKLVITFHNYMLDRDMRRHSNFFQKIHYATDLRFFTKKAVELADTIISVSKFITDLIRKDLNYQGKIHTIYNGVDENRFAPIDRKVVRNKKVIVLFSGNPTLRKGFDILIRMLPLLNDNIEVWYTTGLRNHEVKSNKYPNLKCIGVISYEDMPTLYNSVDILLFPSKREGLSLSALEAMACGLPLVTANSSSFPELITEGEGGYLCDLDKPECFAQRINQLSLDKNKRSSFGERNRTRILKYHTSTGMVNEYKKIFNEIG